MMVWALTSPLKSLSSWRARTLRFENSKILILGLTFKENSRDLRNTGVAELVSTFESFKCEVDVNDPLVHKDDVKKELNINLVENPKRALMMQSFFL